MHSELHAPVDSLEHLSLLRTLRFPETDVLLLFYLLLLLQDLIAFHLEIVYVALFSYTIPV